MAESRKVTKLLGAAGAALLALSGAALADGYEGSIKDAPADEGRKFTYSFSVTGTSDYVFRGISQTDQGPAIQGGFDATCGLFYIGTWASSIDFAGDAHVEIDLYAGIKPKTGPITWDFGVIYYAYPNQISGIFDLNMFEIKVGGSAEVWKGGTFGVTGFYSPDYTGELGPTWTVEGAFSQALPQVGMFSPTFSALIGYQASDDALYLGYYGDDSYVYWNAGMTLGFHEKWSLDLRYWDSNLDATAAGACRTSIYQCDERFVATLKFTY